MAIKHKSDNVANVPFRELNWAFVLFQTTKGASAFKICRGVEAVGGSLRSVTTNLQIPLSMSAPQPPELAVAILDNAWDATRCVSEVAFNSWRTHGEYSMHIAYWLRKPGLAGQNRSS